MSARAGSSRARRARSGAIWRSPARRSVPRMRSMRASLTRTRRCRVARLMDTLLGGAFERGADEVKRLQRETGRIRSRRLPRLRRSRVPARRSTSISPRATGRRILASLSEGSSRRAPVRSGAARHDRRIARAFAAAAYQICAGTRRPWRSFRRWPTRCGADLRPDAQMCSSAADVVEGIAPASWTRRTLLGVEGGYGWRMSTREEVKRYV